MATNDVPVTFTAILAVINNSKLKKKKQIERISKSLTNNGTFDINTIDQSGRCLLHHACNKGTDSILEYLLQLDNININVISNDGTSPLIECMNGYNQTHAGSSKNPIYKTSGLNNALPFGFSQSKADHLKCAQLLLDKGCDTEIKSKIAGYTALHEAAFGKFSAAVSLLCKQPQCNVNCLSNEHETPLILAINERHISICRILLEHKDIDVNIPAYKKDLGVVTPLAMAARFASSGRSSDLTDFNDIFDLLLQKNAFIQPNAAFIDRHLKASGLKKCDSAIEHARIKSRWGAAQKLLLHSLGTKMGQQAMDTKFEIARDRGMVNNMIAIYNQQFANDNAMYLTFQRNIIQSIVLSLKEYKPLSSDLLLIAFRFNYDENGKNNFDDIDLFKVLMQTIEKVLTPPKDHFNFWWFRENILSSSLWFEKHQNNKYFYEILLDLVHKISEKEQQILKDELLINADDEKEKESEEQIYWKKLKLFKYAGDNEQMLRQDAIFEHKKWKKAGLQPLHSLDELNEKSKSATINMSQFVDNNIYLDRLMLIAHFIDSEFQSQIQQIMSNVNGCSVQKGPLKTLQRCLVKTETDYNECKFPKTAKILDIVRCSIKFDKCKDLLNGLHHIIESIESQKSGFKMIARVKNTFALLDMTAPNYADIKINAVFEWNEYCMLVEIQLMLSSFLKFKKRNHSLYSVSRKEDFYKGLVHLQDVIKPQHSFLSAAANGDLKTIYNAIKYDNVDVDVVDDANSTALMHATRSGHLKVIRVLIANGANVNRQNKDDVNCLFIAADRGFLDIVRYLVLVCGANPNPNNMKKLPLAAAALRGHFEIVKILVQNGGIITPKVISCAQGRAKYQIKEYLEKHQAQMSQ